MPAINFNNIGSAVGLKPELGTLGGIISSLTKYIFVFAGLALLLYIISGGFKLMTSSGDPAKVKEGQAVLTNGIVGFLVIFIAYWLVQAIGLIFGIEEIKTIFQ